MMSSNGNPVLTVSGIRRSLGTFTADGKTVEYSNTVVTVLQPFTDDEIFNGAMGLKSTEYKIRGAQFFDDYKHMQGKLPAEAELIFVVDVSRKTPTTKLVKLVFKDDKKIDKNV